MTAPTTIGIFAHVDAGKTTLAEAILQQSGAVKRAGRVDEVTTVMDTDDLERKRGITIYARTASFFLETGEDRREFILVDTPGHRDFAPEAERTLPILDGAILVIDGGDGPVGYTKTLWDLLSRANIPVFLFVNKMDRPGLDAGAIMDQVLERLTEKAVDFTAPVPDRMEALAMADPDLMKTYFSIDTIPNGDIRASIQARKVFPVIFGSALEGEGVGRLLDWMGESLTPHLGQGHFQAVCYKIGYDGSSRLSQVRILSGKLKVKQDFDGEKVHEIRRYQGAAYDPVQEAGPGQVVSLVGPKKTRAGSRIGGGPLPQASIRPVLQYRVERTDQGPEEDLLQALKALNEEMPELGVHYDPKIREVMVHAMGPVILEIIQDRLAREGIPIRVSPGRILFKESIRNSVLGLGHFEPLRHYAEVHLLLEPGEANSGIRFFSEDRRGGATDAQLATIRETLAQPIPGVLAGAETTDIRVSLRAIKTGAHTSAGDLPEAVRRAFRQGLMQAESVLLEPMIAFDLDLPFDWLGRILQELTRLGVEGVDQESRSDRVYFRGRGRLRLLQDFFDNLPAMTGGQAVLHLEDGGYEEMDPEEGEVLLDELDYDPLKDPLFPPSSIFCRHGAGLAVPWDQVADWVHLPVEGPGEDEAEEGNLPVQGLRRSPQEQVWSLSKGEADRIFQETFYANANSKKEAKRREARARDKVRRMEKDRKVGKGDSIPASGPKTPREANPDFRGESWLLVDGYNIIHAWPNLHFEGDEGFETARKKLTDILSEIHALSGEEIILVFDAYRVKGGLRRHEERGGIHLVYTKEAETADQYIAEISREKAKTNRVRVATSDGPVQLIAWREGALILSARELFQIYRDLQEDAHDHHDPGSYPELTHRLGDFLEGPPGGPK